MSKLEVIFNKELPNNVLLEMSEMIIDFLADIYSEEEYIPETIRSIETKFIYDLQFPGSTNSVSTYKNLIEKEEIYKIYKESLETKEKINSELRKTKVIKPKPDFNYPKDHGKLYPFDE